IAINLSGDHEVLRSIVPRLELDLESLPGVTGVDAIGYFDREVHIEVDPIKARRMRVSVGDVARAIESRNLRST
ncbi:efflux RND transporter permease subunit, partial [Myxococcota bacterium]|nr:efflux RND transporter permease subunit [Myxococcota bacterium]